MSELPRLRDDTLQTRAAQADQLWEARQRARHGIADQFETISDPDRVPIRRNGDGLTPAREFLEWAEPQEAAHQFDPEFQRQDLGPADVERVDDGFRPTEEVQRQEVAFEFEDETPLGYVDPFGDLVQQNGGFGLAEGPQREIAAHEFVEETPLEEVDPHEDIQQTDDGWQLTDDATERAWELDPGFF